MKKILILALSAALFITGCGSLEKTKTVETEPTETKEIKEAAKDKPKSEYYFDGNVVEIQDVKITIKETRVIAVGEEGNEYGDKPVFAIWYDTTNKSDIEMDSMDAWFAIFEAIQDNNENMINELSVGMLPDQSHLDTQMAIIKKGGTVENSIAYELDDAVTPVTLIANRQDEEIGRKDYAVK